MQYNPQTQTMSGFVNIGDGLNETDVASEALVFMVVGIQGHWKAPVAYYLTSALSPETLKVLVVHALEECWMMDACHMLKLARNMLQVNADCCSRLICFFIILLCVLFT